MPKSRKLLVAGALTPADLAKTVVGNFVSKGRAELGAWANRYTSKINAYLGNTTAQNLAISKLANWYDVFLTEIYPKLQQAYAGARASYIQRITRRTVPAITPPA